MNSYFTGGVELGWTVLGMLLGAGGLDTGALGEPGPVVELPGVHGVATVAEVPVGCEVPAVVEVEPMPLLLEELVLVEGVPVAVPLLSGVVVLLEPIPVLLLDGVQGAVVVVTPDWPCAVPWFCVPSVPPVVVPGLPAMPGVPGLTAGAPVEVVPVPVDVAPVAVPGVVVVPLWPSVPVVLVAVPGCAVLVPVVLCEPTPEVPVAVLGVPEPVVWAAATPRASAKTDDTSRVFRMEACSLSELLQRNACRKLVRIVAAKSLPQDEASK